MTEGAPAIVDADQESSGGERFATVLAIHPGAARQAEERNIALAEASAPITNADATLPLVQLFPDPTGTVIAATPAGNSNTGNAFRYIASSGQYAYDLSTVPLSAGLRSLRIDLGDGSSERSRSRSTNSDPVGSRAGEIGDDLARFALRDGHDRRPG